MYTVIDIETSGGSPTHDRITEIAIISFNGQKVTNRFSTLINPECKLPYYITNITGITDSMLVNAPKFREIAKEILLLTANKIFVAHNVSFDYNFIKQEFNRLGIDFERKKLCTVQKSRQFIPGKTSYSLGNICSDLNICIENRHRALGDAEATVELLKIIMKNFSISENDMI
jgi:DNA polymerase III subunit epsilon